MSVSMSLGFIVGPALSGLLGSTKYGEIVPVYTTLIISLVLATRLFQLSSDMSPT